MMRNGSAIHLLFALVGKHGRNLLLVDSAGYFAPDRSCGDDDPLFDPIPDHDGVTAFREELAHRELTLEPVAVPPTTCNLLAPRIPRPSLELSAGLVGEVERDHNLDGEVVSDITADTEPGSDVIPEWIPVKGSVARDPDPRPAATV